MRFVGKLRWSQAEEAELYRKIKAERQNLSAKYRELSRHLDSSDPAVSEYLKAFFRKRYEQSQEETEPFFGRIDVSLDENSVISRYIGYHGHESEETRVVDWRSPIASLYYSAHLGRSHYQAPRGRIECLLTLKRVFERARIVSTEYLPLPFYEIKQLDFDEASLFDEYLQRALSLPSEGVMKDIIRTIASKQDEIIRSDDKRILIQGGPGVGKTAVLLHRISYLTYTLNREGKHGKAAFIAPTRVLAGYTVGVFRKMPESLPTIIPVENFVDMCLRQIACSFGIETAEKSIGVTDLIEMELSRHVNNNAEKMLKLNKCFDVLEKATEVLAITLLIKFLDILREHVSDLERDVESVRGTMRRLKSEARSWIESQTDSRAKKELGEVHKIADETDSNLGLLQELITNLSQCSRGEFFRVRLDAIKAILWLASQDEQQYGLHKILKRKKTHDTKIAPASAREIIESACVQFSEFWQRWHELLRDSVELMSPLRWHDYLNEACRTDYLRNLDQEIKDYLQSIDWDGACSRYDYAVVYLLIAQQMFSRIETDLDKFSIIAIDEAQNLHMPILKIIKESLKDESFVIINADSNQALVHPPSSLDEILMLYQATKYELSDSYRSNPLIVRAGVELLKEPVNLHPVRRSGEPPKVLTCSDEQIAAIANGRSEESTAIIVKCKQVGKSLAEKTKLRFISKDVPFEIRGAFIIPLSLCAGLEFDNVILYGVSMYDLDNSEDRSRLYVAATRAIHQLYFHDVDGDSKTMRSIMTVLQSLTSA